MIKKSGLSCQEELAKNVIKSDVFEREIALCKKLSKDGAGACSWGTCKECGVVPLLYKLHKGELMEDKIEIKSMRKHLLDLP